MANDKSGKMFKQAKAEIERKLKGEKTEEKKPKKKYKTRREIYRELRPEIGPKLVEPSDTYENDLINSLFGVDKNTSKETVEDDNVDVKHRDGL